MTAKASKGINLGTCRFENIKARSDGAGKTHQPGLFIYACEKRRSERAFTPKVLAHQ